MNNPTLATDLVTREIAAMLVSFPELISDEEFRLDAIEGETGALELLDKLLGMERDANAQAEAIKARIDALCARKAAAERRKEAYRKLMFRILSAANLRKVTLPEATLSVRATPPSVTVIDEAQIPDQFWREKRELDRKSLAEELKLGHPVPGACLSNGSETLAVRA